MKRMVGDNGTISISNGSVIVCTRRKVGKGYRISQRNLERLNTLLTFIVEQRNGNRYSANLVRTKIRVVK